MDANVKEVLDDDPFLMTYEVARLLRVDRKTVARWAARGLLPSVKTPGGHVRIRRSAIEALLNP